MIANKDKIDEALYKLFRTRTNKVKPENKEMKKHKRTGRGDPYRRPNRVNVDIGTTTTLTTSDLSDLESDTLEENTSKDSKFRKSIRRLSSRNSMRSFLEEEEEEESEEIKEDFYSIGKRIF